MAAPKENLLSLRQLTGTERTTFPKQRDHCVKNRSVLLQADLSSFQSHQHFRVTQLQQYWQELKERKLRAQQHNRELLQQFGKAQDTLKEMMAHNVAMKTIRMEYEQYLEERSPRWQQQLKEKTQLAQRTRMEDCLRSCIKIMGEERVKSSEDQYSYSQGPMKQPQEAATTQEYNSQNIYSNYNQDGSSYLPYIQSSWLTHPQSQTARFPMRVSCQPQSSSHTPRSFLPHPHPFMLNRFTSMTPGHYHAWPRQDPPGWSSMQGDFWTAGAAELPSGSEALWGRLYTEEPPPESRVSQVVAQEVETSRTPSSKSERGGGGRSSRLSQELDIKPVRLSSGHAESSESDSSQVIREKRKKERRGRLHCTSSEKERDNSQESSTTSSAIIVASAAAVKSCESDVSLGKCTTGGSKKRRWRSGGRVAQSRRTENMVKERARSKEDESVSQKETTQCASGESGNQIEESTSENAGTQSADDKSDKCREELGDISLKLKNGAADEKEEQEISSSEQSSAEERDVKEEGHQKHLGCEDNSAEEKENSQKDDKQVQAEEEENEDSEGKENSLIEEKQKEQDEEKDNVFARKEITEEEEETGAEEEMEEQECEDKDGVKNKNCEKRNSASSQDDEEEHEGGAEEYKTEEDEESAEEDDGGGEEKEKEEQRSDKAGEPEEESNSEDSIISPQENRTNFPEEAAEDDNEKRSKTESSDGDDSNDFSEDDIESLLAPQEQRKKEEDMKAAEKPKAVCDNMKIFQVEDDRSTKTDDQSDSDEFDHFYD